MSRTSDRVTVAHRSGPRLGGHLESLITIDTNASTLTEIDNQLVAIADAAIVIRSRRNMVVPISRLAPELFHRIFLFVRSDEGNRRSLRWISVSHVCRYWRELAISNPFLWNQIITSHPELVPVMLQRSQSVPLIVDADEHSFGLLSTLSHITRIRELHVVFPTRRWPSLSICSEMIEASAPILESLAFSIAADAHMPLIFTMPSRLGRQTLPSLQRLKLVDVEFEVTHPIRCVHLTQLEIQTKHGLTSCTMNDLLKFLKETTLLTNLVLRGVLSRHYRTPYTGDPVELPHLRIFRLRNDLEILDHLVVPFSTALAIHSDEQRGNPAGHLPFEKAFEVAIKRMDGEHHCQNIRYVQIGENSDGGPVLRGWLDEAVGPPLMPAFEISVDWSGVAEYHKFSALLHIICRHIPLNGIYSLDIGRAQPLNFRTAGVMHEAFNTFKNLHTFRIRGSCTSNVFRRLAVISKFAHRHKLARPFPELSTIIIEFVDFGHTTQRWDSKYWCGMSGLHDYLAWRKEHHTPVKKLEVHKSTNVTEGRLVFIENFVLEVWWDGEDAGEEIGRNGEGGEYDWGDDWGDLEESGM